MDGGVAHDGVKFFIHLQRLRVGEQNVKAKLLRGGDHLRARVGADDGTAHVRQPLCQNARPAAEVQNPLSRLWLKELYYRFSEFGDEVRALPVLLRVPDLICHK